MNDRLRRMIDELLIDDNGKEVLYATDRILNSDSKSIRGSIFTPLIISSEGCGLSSFGKAYSEIVSNSQFFVQKGNTNFLELVFPKGNDESEKLFFSSPLRAASTTNRFYGTIIVSLTEYEGNDLVRSDSFDRLLEFCKQNKENIRFIFHISPGFKVKSVLISAFQEIFPVQEVNLDKPGLEKSVEYVISEMEKESIGFEEGAKDILSKRLIPMILSRRSFSGYRSLNILIGRMTLEYTMNGQDQQRVITTSVVESLLNRMDKEITVEPAHKIGFSM